MPTNIRKGIKILIRADSLDDFNKAVVYHNISSLQPILIEEPSDIQKYFNLYSDHFIEIWDITALSREAQDLLLETHVMDIEEPQCEQIYNISN